MITVKKIFSSKGPIASSLKKYEKRGEQFHLAIAVEEILEQGGILLGEAGTGTGKTLAYLVPAMLSGMTVVISTGTKNLQEQIFFKDIKFLKKALGLEIRVAYLKGQDNYLCKKRFEAFIKSPACLEFTAKEVSELTKWALTTLHGDRMELADLKDDSKIWSQVCSTRETRIGPRCSFYDECFVTLARKKAMSANIIVVNHHLYFADVATKIRGGTILPHHEAVIFDEAHLIEDIATEFFSVRISSYRVERVIRDTIAVVNGAKLRDDPYEESRKNIGNKAQTLFANLFSSLRNISGRVQLLNDDINENVIRNYHLADSALESFLMTIKALEGRDEGIDHCATRIEGVRDDLGEIIDNHHKKMVYWVDTKQRSVTVGASPIDVSEHFKDEVLFKRDSIVFCSATLSTEFNFNFLKKRLGIDNDVLEVKELILDSPFNYKEQARTYIPIELPSPAHPQYLDASVFEIERLIKLTDGNALVLCTSNKNMTGIYNALLQKWDGEILVQGSAPRSEIVKQFIKNKRSVLVATASFWQGVDIPGDDLKLVIIDKLPFSSPHDPVTEARIANLKEQHIEPFSNYQIPQAVITLKQGFGRLIRTAGDRGIVAILDSRIVTKHYGRKFINSLPEAPVINDFTDLKTWWKH